MKTLSLRVLSFVFFAASLGLNPLIATAGVSGAARGGPSDARLDALAVPFVENRGQTHPDVRFYAQTFGGTLFVTGNGELVYSLPVKGRADGNRVIIREKLIGGHPRPAVGEEPSSSASTFSKARIPPAGAPPFRPTISYPWETFTTGWE